MWRAMFLALGISMIIFGGECLGVEKMLLTLHHPAPPRLGIFNGDPSTAPPKEFAPKPWMPWSLLSTGAVTCLYSVTLGRKQG